MIDFIRTWTISITGAVIFASFIDLLIPKCSVKKYINFTLGLIIIIIIISPIKNIAKGNYTGLDEIIEEYRLSTEEIKDNFLDEFNLKRIFEQKLSKKLNSIISEKFPGTNIYTQAETEFDSENNEYKEIKRINVFISPTNIPASASETKPVTQQTKQDIISLLSKELNIPESKIIFWSDVNDATE